MRTKAILFFLINSIIIGGCKNKAKQNNYLTNQETKKQTMSLQEIEEIKQHLEFQKRVDNDDEEEIIKNPYKRNSRDLELASIVMLEGLKTNGFKPIDDDAFNQRIKDVFGIEQLKSPHYKVHFADGYITLFGNQKEEYKTLVKNEFGGFADTDNYYLLKKEHLFFEFQSLKYLITFSKDNSYKLTILPYHIHRNKYLFNNDKASLAWLLNNDKSFLSMLLERYGYDKESRINKFVLDSIYKDYTQANPARGQYIATLLFVKDSFNKLQIRKGLLKYIEENTSARDNRFIYALGYFMQTLYDGDTKDDNYKIFNEDPSKKFTSLEKAEIVANIANIENPAIEKYKSLESSDVWNIPGSSLYNLSVSHPEVIKLIEEHNYFGLPKMKQIIAKLQDEAPPTGADPE